LAIPVSGSFFYVEPIYLEAIQEETELPSATPTQPKGRRRQATVSSRADRARKAALPELKRVIVALGNRVIMEQNLDKALSSALEEKISRKMLASPSLPQGLDVSNLGALALEHYNKAKAYSRQGNWAEYGKALENLEKVLKEMAEVMKDKK